MANTVHLHRGLAAPPDNVRYLGWQESLRNLARLVEPDNQDQ